MTKIAGGCFCGATRYEVEGPPLGSMICHCRSCRRIAGAPTVPWVTFLRTSLRFTHGTPTSLQSSPTVQRTFCSTCGTPLTYASPKFPNEIDVTTCSLDEPEAFPPTHHSWTSHDLAWLRSSDALPRFPESKQS